MGTIATSHDEDEVPLVFGVLKGSDDELCRTYRNTKRDSKSNVPYSVNFDYFYRNVSPIHPLRNRRSVSSKNILENNCPYLGHACAPRGYKSCKITNRIERSSAEIHPTYVDGRFL